MEASSAGFDEERRVDFIDPIVRDPIGVLVRRWKHMLAAGLVVFAAGVVVAAAMEPLFEARATVSVLGARISENFVQTTVEIGTLDQINAIVSEVLSRKSLAQIVVDHDLFDGADDGDENLERVVQAVRERILISTDSETVGRPRMRESSRVYALTFRDGDPERAAAVANALASSFIDVHLRLRSSEARVTTEFLRRELIEVEEELRAQERLATEFKQANRGELPGELDTNLARLERLQEMRRVLGEQLRDLEMRPADVERIASDDTPEARLAVLRRRLHESLSLYTPDHPNVVALQRQAAALERELGLAGKGPNRRVDQASVLRRRIAAVEQELADLDARVARTPKRQEEQEALDRRLAVLRENYTELLRKVDKAELSESVESAQHGVRVSILDRAVPPTVRDGSRVKVLLLGLLGGLAVSVVAAILLEHFDAVVINSDQIESVYAIPVLGNVPHIS
jgi:uncharacterized protein involved in exopolysaccharide biosynthesis